MMFYSGETGLKNKSANLQPEFAVDPQIMVCDFSLFVLTLNYQVNSPLITDTKSSNK